MKKPAGKPPASTMPSNSRAKYFSLYFSVLSGFQPAFRAVQQPVQPVAAVPQAVSADLHPIAGGERGQQVFAVAEVVAVKKERLAGSDEPHQVVGRRLLAGALLDGHMKKLGLHVIPCQRAWPENSSLAPGIQRFFINGSMRTSALSLTM